MDLVEGIYNKHYIKIDERNRVVDCWSDGPHREKDTTDSICINDKGGYQFRLYPGGEENPNMYTIQGIPLYKWDGSKIIERDQSEIDADIAAIPAPPPSSMEILRSDVDFLLIMTNLA